jgi:POT family proton-dependent oligopeptide transporter
MAFEQAGNALNIWAFENTTRTIFGVGYPATWWQNANSIFIVALGPVAAWLWPWLERRKLGLSTPGKMFVGLVCVALAFATMVVGATGENGTVARVALPSLPEGVDITKYDAGRLGYDATAKELTVAGVLPTVVAADLLAASVDPAFQKTVVSLEKQTRDADKKAPIDVKLESLPPGFAFPYDAAEAEKHGMKWKPADSTIVFTQPVGAAEKVALLGVGAPPVWRKAVAELTEKSNLARVSGFWLVLQYLFATLGELCLSPVGLSMVTKLAPKRFASLFMGVWFLAPSMALYAGGAIGEMWGSITPVSYFWIFVWSSLAGALVLLLLVPPLKRLMHDVT